MQRFTLLALFLSLGIPAPTAWAGDFSLLAGYRVGGSFETGTGTSLDIDESGSFALAVDVDYLPDKDLELFWSHQESALYAEPNDKLFDLDTDYLHVGGTVRYYHPFLIPYVAGGLGATHFNPGSSAYRSETRFSISLAGGVKYFPTERFGVRLEGRGYLTWFPDSGSLFCTSGSGGTSCQIYLEGDALFQFEGLAGVVWRF